MMNKRPGQRHGFTLIEMLVVLGIVMTLVGVGMSAYSQFRNVGAVESTINTISSSLKLTQTLATRPIPKLQAVCDDASAPDWCGYSGVAMLFTPFGEIRMLENDQAAQSAFRVKYAIYKSNDAPPRTFLEHIRMPTPCGRYVQDKTPPVNGYREIDGVDYIRMPRDVGVIGLDRQVPQSVELINPPFAISVTPEGFIVPASRNGDVARSLWVHYDGNYDGLINLAYPYDLADLSGCGGKARNDNPPIPGMWRDHAYPDGSPYDIREWDPTYSGYSGDDNNPTSNGPGRDPISGKYRLPFETIECVIGVLVYSKEDMRAAGFDYIPDTDFDTYTQGYDEAQQWVLENGRAVWFNRYSGVANKGGASN